ncbi:MAG: MarC family protein [Crocosphaera sp.]|nr:MarC family protein [Crocosphaera sp.]
MKYKVLFHFRLTQCFFIPLVLSFIALLMIGLSVNLPVVATPSTEKVIDTSITQEKPVLLAQAESETDTPRPTPKRYRNWEEKNLETLQEFRGALAVGNIFIIFFVTLGPIKIIPTFIKLTQNADDDLRKSLAINSAGLATIVILLVVLIGGNILTKWTVSISALLMAAGIMLFLTSLQVVMSQYQGAKGKEPPPEPSMKLLVNPLTFPTILTPYGIALALILMVFNNRLSDRMFIVPMMLILVMFLNLLAMFFARPILKIIKQETLYVAGMVLGVMQLALGLEIILIGIHIQALILQDLLKLG